MDFSLDELKSRLKMSEVEVKITTSSQNGGGGLLPGSNKKSRKNKTPVFRQQRRPSSGGEENTSPISPKMPEQRASSSPESPLTSEAEKRTLAGNILNEPPLPPPPGGIKSYSDFMRSLAAKYNNNDYFTPTRNGLSNSTPESSPFQPFKTSIAPPPPAPTSVATNVHSLLGLPNPFPFLGAAGLMGDPKANKGPSLPAGLPPGFPNMMDIQHTQALINLARNSNFLPPAPPTVSTSSSTPTAPTPFPESKKRPAAAPALQTTEQVLDLSPSMQSTNASSLAKKAKLDLKVSDSTILNWSVSEVCNFVATIDICREYSEVFREHNIDGSALPLLTEDHLTLRLGLKLGPALKLRSIISKKLGPTHADICAACAHCNSVKMTAENIENNSSEDTLQQPRSASRTSSLGGEK